MPGAEQCPATVCCWQRSAADEPAWREDKDLQNGGVDRPKANAEQHPHGGRSASRRHLGSCPTHPTGAGRDELAAASWHDPRSAGLARPTPGIAPAAGQQPPPTHRVRLRAAAARSVHAGAGNSVAGVGLGARSVVHRRAAQSRPGAADADSAPRRRWPWHWSLDSAIAQEALEAIGDATEATTEAAPSPGSDGGAPPVTPESLAAPGTTDVPEGAVRGDGTATCPPAFPIKGNMQSMIYHTAESRVYGQTIAEICFSSPEAAEAAGYVRLRTSRPPDDSFIPGRACDGPRHSSPDRHRQPGSLAPGRIRMWQRLAAL